MKQLFIICLCFLFFSCGNSKNSPEFKEKVGGKYFFNAFESIEIYFKNDELRVKWRGRDDIEPLKVNDSTFYVKELNEKIVFVSKPEMHIELAEKGEHDGEKFSFKKMGPNEMTPMEYLEAKKFDKALTAYLNIKKSDSLNPAIQEYNVNKLGYKILREHNDIDLAIQILTINTALYPKSSNTYDSLAEAYWKKKDTANAIINYRKVLSINSENKEASNFIKKFSSN
uniref:tetratricopeptide repeat protein n=1 Tax=Polaribacter sp. TaxID=1920175 RepID=UPI00404773AE